MNMFLGSNNIMAKPVQNNDRDPKNNCNSMITPRCFQSFDNDVPYHGAGEVNINVRKIIFNTNEGELIPMSTSLMIKLLIDRGMKEGLAKKLPSQIRKGAPLYFTWKAAFDTKRFLQITGRTKSHDGEGLIETHHEKKKKFIESSRSKSYDDGERYQMKNKVTLKKSNYSFDSAFSPLNHQTNTNIPKSTYQSVATMDDDASYYQVQKIDDLKKNNHQQFDSQLLTFSKDSRQEHGIFLNKKHESSSSADTEFYGANGSRESSGNTSTDTCIDDNDGGGDSTDTCREVLWQRHYKRTYDDISADGAVSSLVNIKNQSQANQSQSQVKNTE